MSEFGSFDSYKLKRPDFTVSKILYRLMVNFLAYTGRNHQSKEVLHRFCLLAKRMARQKMRKDPRIQDVDLFRRAIKRIDVLERTVWSY